MPKSKFFRIAVEGGTTDGRTIERNWLEEMAADYNPTTYSARVNMEHIRGFSAEPPFNAYGDVLALETREIELELAGKKEKRLALYASIDATDELVTLNGKRQKLFTSCEINPNFAGKGRAYLVGLAVTDSPASLGTEMLAFAAGQGDNSPLAARKLDKGNLFTAADELELAIEEANDAGELKGIVAMFASVVEKLTGKPTEAAPVATPPAPVVDQAAPNADQVAAFVQLGGAVTQLATALEKNAADTAASVTALTQRVDDLAGKLDKVPASFTERPLATGGDGQVLTDC